MSNRGRKRKFPAGYDPKPWRSPVYDSDVELDDLLHGNVYGADGAGPPEHDRDGLVVGRDLDELRRVLHPEVGNTIS